MNLDQEKAPSGKNQTVGMQPHKPWWKRSHNQRCKLVRGEKADKLPPPPPSLQLLQNGMGAIGSIIDLFAAEAVSGMDWFLYFFNCHNWNTFFFPFTSHFDSYFNQDQLHLHLTPTQL